MRENPQFSELISKISQRQKRQQEIRTIAERAEFYDRIPVHEIPTARLILDILPKNRWGALSLLGNENEIDADLFDIKVESPSLAEILIERLKQKPLIDLGCGKNLYYSLKLAQDVQASMYIGVDRFHQPDPRDFLDPEEKKELEQFGQTTKGKLKIRTIQEDMLIFLAELPENYGNIMINQIDEFILNLVKGHNTNRRYLELLIEEIRRVIGNENIAFGLHSEIVFERLKNMPETKIYEHPSGLLIATASPIPNFPNKEELKNELREKIRKEKAKKDQKNPSAKNSKDKYS